MDTPSLSTRAYALLRIVPKGRVTTYKALAHALGTRAYRAIGQAMRRNPYSFEACPERSRRVPCHRVVASDGTIGGFMGKRQGAEIAKKLALLTAEGVQIHHNRVVNLSQVLFSF